MQKGEPANRFPFVNFASANAKPGNRSPAGFIRPAGLFGGLCRSDRYEDFRVGTGAEGHRAVHECIDGVVLAQANAGAGMPLGAALADDDIASDDGFATELLDAETTASGIT